MVDIIASKKPVILLADDESSIREVTAEILQCLDCTILQAADGQEALKLFEIYYDDIVVVLLDMMMPYYSGLEVAECIREKNKSVPIIFISGYDKERVLGSNKQPPNSMFFSKPVKFKALIQSVAHCLHAKASDGS